MSSPAHAPPAERPGVHARTRVAFVNHTGAVSGAERALLDLVDGLEAAADPIVLAPEGRLAEELRARGVRHQPIRGTAGSLKLHPAHTPLALAELIRSGAALRGAVGRARPDVLHLNSERAALIAIMAGRRSLPPAVVQIHDCLPPSRAALAVRRAAAATASVVVANSRYTARRFLDGGVRARVEVVYNPIDLGRFDPARIDRDEARARLGLPAGAPVLGVVAQLTPWKGQDTAVRALAAVRRRHPDALLLLVGEAKFVSRATRFDNRSYVASLEATIGELGLEHAVRFLGEREDVPEILRALDVALVPSWEEPFGRAVVEALAMGTPVVATSAGGPAEVISDGRDGRLVPPRDAQAWAAAIEALLDDPELRAEMGRRGLETAARFGRDAYAERMLALYDDVAGSRP